MGHIPYGWRVTADGRTLATRVEEQQTIATVLGLQSRGYTLIDIASELEAIGLRNREGRSWRRQFIGQLLDRHPAKIA